MKFKELKKVFGANGKETFAHLHPKRSYSRREMLANGLLPFAARLAAPSLLQLFAQAGVAEAQEIICPKGNTTGLVPIVTLNLAGGAALSANWVPMDSGLNMLPSYDKMGLGSGRALVLDRALGGAPFAGNNVSQILVGIKATAVNAISRTAFVGVPVTSQDDSSINKFDVTGLVAKAGYQGAFLPNLGKRNTVTGTNNSFAYAQPPTPVPVGSQDDIEGAIAIKGSLASLSATQKAQMFKMVKDLNTRQVASLSNFSGGTEMGMLVNCSAKTNYDLSATTNLPIDPVKNAALSTVWGLNQNSDRRSQAYVFASMIYNGLTGNAGTVNLDMGGYDYHNGTRTSGNQMDLAAGQTIGRILESAYVLKKKMFLVVTSDGSVSSAQSDSVTSPWMSDRGSAGCAYMMAFDPAKRPQTSGYQLGSFNKGQGADDKFLTGGSAEIAAAAIFANYLNFSGQIAKFEPVLPRVFSTEQLNLVLKIFG